MARADPVRRLVAAYGRDDAEFRRDTADIVDDERRAGHRAVAADLVLEPATQQLIAEVARENRRRAELHDHGVRRGPACCSSGRPVPARAPALMRLRQS